MAERYVVVSTAQNEICRGDSGGFLVFDKISGTMSEWEASPENISFFNLTVNNEREICKEQDIMQANNTNIDLNENHSNSNHTKVNIAIWNDGAVQLLFTLYDKYKSEFKSTTIKRDAIWAKITKDMRTDGGYNFITQQVKDKWTNMRKVYMRVKDHNKQSGVAPKTCKNYDEMDAIYAKKPNVNPVAIASNLKCGTSSKAGSSIEDSSNHASSNDEGNKKKETKVERQLSTWTENFIEHSNENENRREQRQKEQIAAIQNATDTFKEIMGKLIEKL